MGAWGGVALGGGLLPTIEAVVGLRCVEALAELVVA
jgi:hypothetical protein